jgi:hypothetical protein
MALDGESCKMKSTQIGSPTVSVSSDYVLANPNPGCCDDFVLNVLADNSGDTTKNDVNTVINWLSQTATAATLTLYKWIDGAWVSKAVISDNTYGTFNAFATFVNSSGQKFIYLEVSWAAVLAAFGTGMYKFITGYTDNILGSGTIDSYIFCLKTFTAQQAEGTIRLEYTLSGVTEDIFDDSKRKDFGTLQIRNHIRTDGYFGYPKSPYQTTNIEYDNGVTKWVEDKRLPVFECEIKFAPEYIHQILRTDFMMADELAITDYNSRNNSAYITKGVLKDSEYSPAYYQLQNNSAPVSLKFKPRNNNSRKFRA